MFRFFSTRAVRIIFFLLISIQWLSGQSVYKILATKDIDMKLSGTSTLHNWVMNAQTFTGEAQFIFNVSNADQLKSIKSLSFNLVVTDLKSGEKGLDKNAYKALKTDQYKDILYKLASATVMPEQDGKYLIKTQGALTIAGVTKNVSMDVYAVINKDGSITCTGSNKLKMTDYQVKPPKFMLGAMKTGDDITLNYTLIYKKELL
jgi:polyisoprenoid-binding protein YceI